MTILTSFAIVTALILYHAWALSVIGHWYGFNMPYKEWFGILLLFRLMSLRAMPKEINVTAFWLSATVGPLVMIAVAYIVLVLL